MLSHTVRFWQKYARASQRIQLQLLIICKGVIGRVKHQAVT
jgi:hypothetical protein